MCRIVGHQSFTKYGRELQRKSARSCRDALNLAYAFSGHLITSATGMRDFLPRTPVRGDPLTEISTFAPDVVRGVFRSPRDLLQEAQDWARNRIARGPRGCRNISVSFAFTQGNHGILISHIHRLHNTPSSVVPSARCPACSGSNLR